MTEVAERGIVLVESSPVLEDLCRSIERRLAQKADTAGLVLPVEMLDNFDDVPEASLQPLSPMGYLPSGRKILVNAATVGTVPASALPGALAHEIGHAVLADGARVPDVAALGRKIPECTCADLLACRWGFAGELRIEREKSFGAVYCLALDEWNNSARFVAAMQRYVTSEILRRSRGK